MAYHIVMDSSGQFVVAPDADTARANADAAAFYAGVANIKKKQALQAQQYGPPSPYANCNYGGLCPAASVGIPTPTVTAPHVSLSADQAAALVSALPPPSAGLSLGAKVAIGAGVVGGLVGLGSLIGRLAKK